MITYCVMSTIVCLARGAPFDIRGGMEVFWKNKTKQKKKHKKKNHKKQYKTRQNKTSTAVEAGKKKTGGKKFKSGGEMVIFEEKTSSPVRPRKKKQTNKNKEQISTRPQLPCPPPPENQMVRQPARRHQTHLLIYISNLENKVIHSSLDL